MNWAKVFMIIFLLTGLFMLYKASQENEIINNLLKTGVETEAIVIENLKESTDEGYSYRPDLNIMMALVLLKLLKEM
jgi:hypothetical protein